MTGQKRKINQHIVPQAYLRRFSEMTINGSFRIGVRMTCDNKIKLFSQSVRQVGYLPRFYNVYSRDDVTFWEDFMADNVEPLYGSFLNNVISKIILSVSDDNILTEVEKNKLSQMIITQIARSPVVINHQAKNIPAFISKYKRDFISQYAYILSRKTIKHINNIYPSEDEIKDIQLSIIGDKERMDRLSDALCARTWIIYVLSEDVKIKFMTSDNPVQLYNLSKHSSDYSENGIGRNDSVLYYPLTPKILLQIVPYGFLSALGFSCEGQKRYFLSAKAQDFIIACNWRQMNNCYRQSYMSMAMYRASNDQ